MDTSPNAWWQTGVIYQVYPRSFQDTNADGIGDLSGITQRLQHVIDLGVDALWISPIFPSPMKDFGYDVSNHCDIGLIFGAHLRVLRVARQERSVGQRPDQVQFITDRYAMLPVH
jgi:alpha-glucosidase